MRTRAMCLRLSDDERDKLTKLSRELGMPRASLIRQWIRNAVQPAPMPPPEELRRQILAVFGDKIKRRR